MSFCNLIYVAQLPMKLMFWSWHVPVWGGRRCCVWRSVAPIHSWRFTNAWHVNWTRNFCVFELCCVVDSCWPHSTERIQRLLLQICVSIAKVAVQSKVTRSIVICGDIPISHDILPRDCSTISSQPFEKFLANQVCWSGAKYIYMCVCVLEIQLSWHDWNSKACKLSWDTSFNHAACMCFICLCSHTVILIIFCYILMFYYSMMYYGLHALFITFEQCFSHMVVPIQIWIAFSCSLWRSCSSLGEWSGPSSEDPEELYVELVS